MPDNIETRENPKQEVEIIATVEEGRVAILFGDNNKPVWFTNPNRDRLYELIQEGDTVKILIDPELKTERGAHYDGEFIAFYRQINNQREQIFPKLMPEPGEQNIENTPPTPEPQPTTQAESQRRQEQASQLSKQMEAVVVRDAREELMNHSMGEVARGAIKTIEEKSGKKLEFSSEEYNLAKKYIQERVASLLSQRAERYLQAHRNEVVKRAMDPEAKGAQAIQYIETLGVVRDVIQGDKELENIYFIQEALNRFSAGEIPPSARYGLLDQLNELQELDAGNEELQKLRRTVFEKWSGREPHVSESALDATAEAYADNLISQKAQEIKNNLAAEEISYITRNRLDHGHFARLKDLGYQISITKNWFGFGKKDKVTLTLNGASMAESNLYADRERRAVILSEWEQKVKADIEPEIQKFREKRTGEFASAFIFNVTNKSGRETVAIYGNIKQDILNKIDLDAFIETKEGEKAIEAGQEAIGEGGRLNEFMRNAQEGWEQEEMIDYLKDYGVDITPERLSAFQESSGLDYVALSKKRRGTMFYMLRLISHIMQEGRRIKVLPSRA